MAHLFAPLEVCQKPGSPPPLPLTRDSLVCLKARVLTISNKGLQMFIRRLDSEVLIMVVQVALVEWQLELLNFLQNTQ